MPVHKPRHLFFRNGSNTHGDDMRLKYDEYIPYVDAEFDRLYRNLEQSGMLENTLLILTSDHGEMFERGFMGHGWETMHEAVLRVPLMIFEPGRKERLDIYDNTSAVDLLPTLLHITEQEIPGWCEGQVLPPYHQTPYDPNRSIFAAQAAHSPRRQPLKEATGMILKGEYKLSYYIGYDRLPEGEPLIELFDVRNDPDELENLYPARRSLANELLEELIANMQAADEPYQ